MSADEEGEARSGSSRRRVSDQDASGPLAEVGHPSSRARDADRVRFRSGSSRADGAPARRAGRDSPRIAAARARFERFVVVAVETADPGLIASACIACAGIACAAADDLRAARLLGAAAAVMDLERVTLDPVDAAERRRIESSVRRGLGSGDYLAALADGVRAGAAALLTGADRTGAGRLLATEVRRRAERN